MNGRGPRPMTWTKRLPSQKKPGIQRADSYLFRLMQRRENIAWMAWIFNSWVYCSLTDKILAIQLGIKIAIGFLAISPRVPTEMLELANYLAVQTNAIGTWQTHVQHSNGNEDFPSAPGTFIGCVSESCSKSSELSSWPIFRQQWTHWTISKKFK